MLYPAPAFNPLDLITNRLVGRGQSIRNLKLISFLIIDRPNALPLQLPFFQNIFNANKIELFSEIVTLPEGFAYG
jgi:hypothetical protein